MSAPYLYASFAPGALIGRHRETITPSLVTQWEALYGPAHEPGISPAILQMLMMRSYLKIVTPRPPGNIHAQQRFTLLGLPEPGMAIDTDVRCASREERNGRLRVALAVSGAAGRRALFEGIIGMIWAA